MTDKQIIIDGIDVSGCEYYFDEKCRCMDASIMQDFYLCPQCNNNPNCSYKKWKSKEQECEELKREINSYVTITDESLRLDNRRLADEKRDLQQQLNQLKTENERLEAHLATLDAVIETGKAQYKELQQTLTEIKEILQLYNNTTIGIDKGNGIFEFEVSKDNILGRKIICHYDTNPAKKALQKISEVIPNEN